MASHAHHYALDAVPLLDECIGNLQITIDQDLNGQHDSLYDLKAVLLSCERFLHQHLTNVLAQEQKCIDLSNTKMEALGDTASIMGTMRALKIVLKEKQRQEVGNGNRQKQQSPYSSRSATDTLLFRLIVALQLCLLRISDAHLVTTGHLLASAELHRAGNEMLLVLTGVMCLVGTGILVSAISIRQRRERKNSFPKIGISRKRLGLGGLLLGKFIHSKLKNLWMRDKLKKSTTEIDEWIQQWKVVQLTRPHDTRQGEEQSLQRGVIDEVIDDKSRRLIEYALQQAPKSSFRQYSQGEIRFLMLKRFMEVYYASVSTAIDTKQTSSWHLPLVTGAAASFYSLTGASRKASQAVNSASSRDLIQHAWGMVSLPAIKSLMLQASRLIKGASVADRINICGVSCFVLSRGSAPELAAAINRQYKSQSALASRLSTITESEESTHDEDIRENMPQKQFAGTSGRYRQRDVIFHLTGGGFFSHIIGSDLPYLLDWSGSTGAVVICPEYALLPEHAFPVALEQIAAVYSTLVDGDAVMDLGFEVNRIVVTGESTGGNLAAALCVKLGQDKLEEEAISIPADAAFANSMEAPSVDTFATEVSRLPDAVMLSCAALNLSLELSYSRVLGKEDPVLPSGLISAISDAYLPEGFSKKDPLASPFFSPDTVLRRFPPVLLFAGSNDPLLDDSVAFNERLRSLGVDSELRAAHNLPHAYWGLGTAGFPEALQVQEECQEWLARQLST